MDGRDEPYWGIKWTQTQFYQRDLEKSSLESTLLKTMP